MKAENAMTDNANAPGNDAGDLNQLERELSEAVTINKAVSQGSSDTTNTSTSDTSDDIPAKYKGKSTEELIRMNMDAQSTIGRISNDLGTQRKLTDRILDLKRTDDLQRQAPAPVQVTADALLENPAQAIRPVVDAAITAAQDPLNQRLSRLEAELAQERFVTRHPDYQERANDPEFIKWVNKTPFRQRVAAQAVNGDVSAADELLSEFKESQTTVARQGTNSADETRQARLDAARRASTEGSAASAGKGSGKVYRRADLIRLKIEKPHVYSDPAFQEEIVQAYADGRVK